MVEKGCHEKGRRNFFCMLQRELVGVMRDDTFVNLNGQCLRTCRYGKKPLELHNVNMYIIDTAVDIWKE